MWNAFFEWIGIFFKGNAQTANEILARVNT